MLTLGSRDERCALDKKRCVRRLVPQKKIDTSLHRSSSHVPTMHITVRNLSTKEAQEANCPNTCLLTSALSHLANSGLFFFFFRSHGRMVNAESWRRLIGSSSSASDTRRRQKAVTQSCEGQDARGKSWQQMRPKPFAKKWTMESPRGSGKPNEHLDAQRRSSRNPRRAIVRLTPKLLLERSPPLLAKREGPGDAAPEAPRTQPNDSRKDAKAHRKGNPKQHQKLVENSTWKPRKRRS